MHVLGIIPARGGSKRVARKNMRRLGGKPLVARAIEAALAARCLDRLVVSSDDAEILRVAASYGPELPLLRPAELAGDRALAIEYVRHALAALESGGGPRFDAVTIVQPSSPLTRAEDVDATVALLERPGAKSAVSVMRLDHAIHPVKLKRRQGELLLPYLEEERGRMATHELPALYVRNGAVYASRRSVIEQGEVLGDPCYGYLMARERSVDVNEEFDLLLAEFLLQRLVEGRRRAA